MKSFSTRLFTSTCDGGLNIVMPCTLMYKAVKSKSGSKAVQRSRKHTQRDTNSHIGSLLYSFKHTFAPVRRALDGGTHQTPPRDDPTSPSPSRAGPTSRNASPAGTAPPRLLSGWPHMRIGSSSAGELGLERYRAFGRTLVGSSTGSLPRGPSSLGDASCDAVPSSLALPSPLRTPPTVVHPAEPAGPAWLRAGP